MARDSRAFDFLYLNAITHDETTIKAIRIVLFIDIVLEVWRSANLVYGNTLKLTGDSVFPMIVSLPITFACTIGATYLFGVVMNLGVIGAYIGLTVDECVRGLIMVIRWKKGKWEQKVLVQFRKPISEKDEAQTSK